MLPAYLAFSLLFCPHPPNPLPLRGRGGIKVISCKGLRPLHPPGAESGRHRGRDSKCRRGLAFFLARLLCLCGGRTRAALAVSAASGSFFQKRTRAVAPSIKIREKFWGVWGTLSRVPQRFSLPPPQPCFYLLIDNKEKRVDKRAGRVYNIGRLGKR